MKNDAFKYIATKWDLFPSKWLPFLSVYYLTYRCDFRCTYCSDGSGIPYHDLVDTMVPAAKAISILSRLRSATNYIVLTGGEPLCHPELPDILSKIPSLRFKDVILTTNGFALDRHLDGIARAVRTLGISVDTLDPEKADRMHGTRGRALNTVLANVETAIRLRPRTYKVMISSVVTPDNIQDIYEVFDYAQERGLTHAVCPQLVGRRGQPDLVGNADYIQLFNYLLEKKKAGAGVYGTVRYLEQMRDFADFQCHPFTMVTIAPDGTVFYPCLEIGYDCGNILGQSSLHPLKQNGVARHGPPPECSNGCHSACALGFSTILQHPRSMVEEAFMMAKSWVGTSTL